MNGRQRDRRREHDDAPAVHDPEPAEPLVSEREIEAIRWAGYDTAIADAIAYRDRALDAALERLDKVTRGGYMEYRRALEAADAAFTAARRAAMHAHELAQAGQTLAPGYDNQALSGVSR